MEVGSGVDGALDGGLATATVMVAVRWRKSDGGNGDAMTMMTTLSRRCRVASGGRAAGAATRRSKQCCCVFAEFCLLQLRLQMGGAPPPK